MATLTIATAPTVEPVSLIQAKEHLLVPHGEDDTKLTRLIKTARRHVERVLRRRLINSTWDLFLDCFPSEPIEIPFPPLSSVTSVKYIDEDGAEQTESSATYTVDTDTEPGRVYLAYDQTWPNTRGIRHAVTIRHVCGYGAAATNVPDDAIDAVLLVLEKLYRGVNTNDAAIDALLWGNRIVRV